MKITYDVLFESSDLSGQSVLNTAKAQASNQKDPDKWVEDNNEVTLAKPKLAIKKSSNRVTFKPDEIGEYTITVTNKSTTATAKNVVVKDHFEINGVMIQKNSIKIKNGGKEVEGASMEVGDNSFTINTNQDLAPNEDMEITYLAKFTEKGTYKNIAKATSDNTDPVEDDNTVEVTKTGVSPRNITPTNIINTITNTVNKTENNTTNNTAPETKVENNTTPETKVESTATIAKDVKTGDVVGLVVLIALAAGIGYLGLTVAKKFKRTKEN